MLMDNGFFDWMQRLDGPRGKLWFPDQKHTPEGVVLHSAVGTFQGVINVVLGPASNGRSVTGVFAKDGRAVQFYSVFDAPWANGSRTANTKFRGWENEGGIDTPSTVSELLTDAQIECCVRMMRDMREHRFDLAYRRPFNPGDLEATCWEHNEMTRFGADPTACPSNRIPWNTILTLVNNDPAPQPEQRYWVCGNTQSGTERVGKQTVYWNNGVPGYVVGNADGSLPGSLWHLVGPDWSKDWELIRM